METTSHINVKLDYIQLAKDIHSDLIRIRQDIHMHPELQFDVFRTAKLVADELRSYGITVKEQVGQTGVVGDLIIIGATKTIALRADMDALPIQELNDIPYRSKTDMKAHLCGHDAHTSMLLSAARVLAQHKDQLKQNIRFIFQPSEEAFPGGAPGMIKDGCLDGVNEIYALHVWPALDVGRIGICVGPTMAQGDGFTLTVTGRGGHAAAPHKAIDPIVITAEIITAFQTIVARHVNPEDTAVVSVTQIHAGSSFNAIPDDCVINGTVRTYKKEVQKLIKERMQSIVDSVCAAHGAKAAFNYLEGYPVLTNPEKEALLTRDIARELVGDKVVFPAEKVMFGEDFAYYLQNVGGCYIYLGCKNDAKGINRMLHDPRFNIDEDCMIYGTAMHLSLAFKS